MNMQDCLENISSTISDFLVGYRPSISSLFLYIGIGFVSAPAHAWDCKLTEGVWQRNITINNGCKYRYENVKVQVNNRQVVIQPSPTGQCVPINKCSCLDDNNKPSSGPVVSSRYGHPGSQVSCEQFTRNFNLSSGSTALNSNDGKENWNKNSSYQSDSIRPTQSSSSATPYNLPYETTLAENETINNSNDQPEADASDDAKNMSHCLEVVQSSLSITSFKNNCNQQVAYTFCAANSKNPALKCKARYSTLIGQDDYGKGGGTVSAGAVTYITPDHGESIRWFACEVSATPYLTSYNPPKGVCFSGKK